MEIEGIDVATVDDIQVRRALLTLHSELQRVAKALDDANTLIAQLQDEDSE